ncbi:cell adhesion molecule DSCAML1-like [Montipora foliosa]|uniref:cell adhesion molecule DSCAML1-like n=1 Tax=Montipora foliosa TaxID=591990 RepID=UPI0035F1D392
MNFKFPSKAPSNFTVTANTSTVIVASWQLPSPDSRNGIIRGFKIFFRKKGSDNRPETIFVSTASMYKIPVTGLAKFTEYEFHVLAFTSAGDGMNSSVQFAKTKEDIPSKGPSEFMVTAITSTIVTAAWQLPPTDSRNGVIKGFKLFIDRIGSDEKPDVQLIDVSNASVYTKNVTGLQEFTEYELQVLAYTSVGNGPKSSVQFVKTKEDAPSKPPSGFVLDASTSTSVTASWQLPPTDSRNGIIKGFKLFINRKGSDDEPVVQFIEVSLECLDVYTRTVGRLQESTEYELWVLAYTSAGDGPDSSVQFVKTPESATILPVALSISGLSLLASLLFIGFTYYNTRRKKRLRKWTAKDIKVLNSCEIPPPRIKFLEELGQGAFGKVHKARLIHGLEFFAKTPKWSKTNCKVKIVAIKQLHGEYKTNV